MAWTVGSSSGSATLTGLDQLIAGHINELREAIDQTNSASQGVIAVGPSGDNGYVTDGVADDIQIQAAVNVLSGNGGGVVQLEATGYHTTAQINLASTVSIVGRGMGATVIFGSPPTSDWIIRASVSGSSKAAFSNIWIKDLTLASVTACHSALISNTTNAGYVRVEAYHTQWSTAIRESLVIQHCANAVHYDCWIHDCTGDGVQVNGCDYFHVRGNRITNFFTNVSHSGIYHMDDGIDIDEDFLDSHSVPCRYGLVEDNTVQGITLGNNVRLASSQWVSFKNNQSLDCALASSAGAAILINSYSGLGHPDTHHIFVDDNIVVNTDVTATSNGIAVVDGGGGLISDIYVRRNSAKGAGALMPGGNVGAGILIAADGVIAIDNDLDACGKSGADGGGIVLYRSGNNSLLRRNRVLNSAGAAIRFWNGDGLQSYTGIALHNTQLAGNSSTYANLSIATLTSAKQNDGLNPDVGYAIGNSGTSKSVDRANGNHQTITMTGNCTFTFIAGNVKGDVIALEPTQDATGSRTASWPSNFKKAGGSLTLSTSAGATDMITARWDGTNWVEQSRSLNVS